MLRLFRKPDNATPFEAEVTPHLDTLYATALRLTRSESEAEDLVQETLLKAYRFRDKFQAGTNMKAWLLRIETNAFINKYRRRTRERAVFDGVAAEPVGEGTMSRAAIRGLSGPIEAAQRSLLLAEIQKALDELPEEQRLMVVLADVEELSYKEIAEIVGCPLGTVMSRLHRARKALQAKLVDQAVAFGIIDETEEAEAPVNLAAYRRGREVAG